MFQKKQHFCKTLTFDFQSSNFKTDFTQRQKLLGSFWIQTAPLQGNHEEYTLQNMQILNRVLNKKVLAPKLGSAQCEMLTHFFFFFMFWPRGEYWVALIYI